MSGCTSISIEKRAQVLILKEDGHTHKAIGERLGIHYKSVSYILKKHAKTGSVQDRQRSGRPRKSTAREDKLIRRAAIVNQVDEDDGIGTESKMYFSKLQQGM